MRILVAMSGGVDSSVAALLLKQEGLDVVGAYMKNWINEDNLPGDCPWAQDIEDARTVAGQIGIEFRVVNLMHDYRRLVVDYLLDGYARGLTPNPDVMCNREIKFGVFRAYAHAEGFAAIATGHYARRVERNGNGAGLDLKPAAFTIGAPAAGSREEVCHSTDDKRPAAEGRNAARLREVRHRETRPAGMQPLDGFGALNGSNGPACAPPCATCDLFEGVDKNKDQSYFLALLSQQQLRDARFPLGHLTKPEVRTLAADHRLATARKKDSQGICFIGEVKMPEFLRAYVPDRPGPIIRARDGCEIGRHRGLHYYTIGQRKRIGVPSNTDFRAYVVVGKRAADNALLVAFDAPDAPGLFVQEIRVQALTWIGEPVLARRSLEGRVRYRDPRARLEFVPEEGGTALIRFPHPQRALAPGQILAFYDGEQLLGGGVYV